MKDKKPTVWGIIWMIVALIGLVGTLLGKSHYFAVLLIGTIMVYITGDDDYDKHSN